MGSKAALGGALNPRRRRRARAWARRSLSPHTLTFKLDLNRPMMGFSAGTSGFFLGAMVGGWVWMILRKGKNVTLSRGAGRFLSSLHSSKRAEHSPPGQVRAHTPATHAVLPLYTLELALP
jgi:hypothetical protein